MDLAFGDETRNGRRLYLITFIFFVEWEANSVLRCRVEIKKSIQVLPRSLKLSIILLDLATLQKALHVFQELQAKKRKEPRRLGSQAYS